MGRMRERERDMTEQKERGNFILDGYKFEPLADEILNFVGQSFKYEAEK